MTAHPQTASKAILSKTFFRHHAAVLKMKKVNISCLNNPLRALTLFFFPHKIIGAATPDCGSPAFTLIPDFVLKYNLSVCLECNPFIKEFTAYITILCIKLRKKSFQIFLIRNLNSKTASVDYRNI